ncbi:aldo/keto reductase [Streptomyces sp. NBC_00006]|uniref:aldo/keto reductase n=1 Tax=unclassified Streptomyces TaxID=2593676 RepID=UPI002253787D|nr:MULTISPECIES: aldo/keto reductase [unclassified Streptomyces]MCX5537037.1 aldo/keto reductase [Streptomyces sp. NBC_00006]
MSHSPTTLRSRTLGRSGVPITELVLGTAALGHLYTPVEDDQAHAAVDTAWDVGVRAFDTAPHYGLGLAERRLGAALADRPRDTYVVSTKVGRLLIPGDGGQEPRRVWDFSADGVRRSLEESLTRLGLDRVDIAYLHDPDGHEEQALAEAYPALEKLRAEGVVRAIGAGMNQTAMLTRFVRDTDVDVVLCAGRHTLLDPGARADLLPAAQRHGVAVLVGGVYNSGLLADPRPGATYDYTEAPRALVGRALRLKEAAERHGTTLRAAALAFAAAPDAVTALVMGARSAAEVHDFVRQFRAARDVPPSLWSELVERGLLAETDDR